MNLQFHPISRLGARTGTWLLACLVALSTVAPSWAVTLSNGLDRDTIRIGEMATMTVTFLGGNPSGQPPLPSIPNLTIQAAGIFSEVVMVNGQTSTALSIRYRVIPSQPGTYIIPPIHYAVAGTTLPTTEMRLNVLGSNALSPNPTPSLPPPSPAQPPPQPQAPEQAFLRLNIPKTEVYLGEMFPVEVQLYFISGQDIQLPNLRCEGFTVNKMVPQQNRVQVGNQIYNQIIFRTVAIPVKSGALNFGPAEINITIHDRKDPFSPLTLKQVSPLAPPKPMTVLPLPTNGVPAGFSGAVGNFSMVANAGPTNLTVGDPITLKVQIAGRGALDNVLLPSLEGWRGYKAYTPVHKLDMPDILSMSGIKSFEQIVVPENAEVKEIPALNFSFFDPDQKTYRTLTKAATPITVRPHGGAAQQPTVLTNVAQAPQGPTDIVHIKTYSGALGSIQPPLVRQPWFLALQIVPVGLWIGLYLRRRKIDNLANNPKLRRHREVAALVAHGIGEMRQLAAQNQAEPFYATAFHLLQEQLGERLDLPASAITEAIVEERMRPLNISDDILKAVHEAFQICNQARYARERTSQELASLADHFERVLQQLQGVAN
jgi:hypothetical protein